MSPTARRQALSEAAATSVLLTPERAAALIGAGWSAARVSRIRSGTICGAVRVWQAENGMVRLSARDGLRSVGNPTGRPMGTVER